MFLAADPLCKSQMLTQTTAIFNLGKALITCSFDANIMSLKIYVFLKMPSMISRVMEPCFTMYRSPIIFKYNLNLDK